MAANQISINTGVVEEIFGKIETEIGKAQEALTQVDREVGRLDTDGEWKGSSYDKFISEYDSEIKETITSKVSELLTQLNKNIDTCKKNLIEADDTNG